MSISFECAKRQRSATALKVVGWSIVTVSAGDIQRRAGRIFVQIGLLPNTHWLEGALERKPHGRDHY